jgi:hypothetical protein
MYEARGLLFISAGESELAARLYGPAVRAKGPIAGGGIEFGPLEALRDAPLPSQLEGKRFVLFLGRRDPGKGADLLVARVPPHARSPEGSGPHPRARGPRRPATTGRPAKTSSISGSWGEDTRAWRCCAIAWR